MHVELDRDGDSFKVVLTGYPREVLFHSRDLPEIQKRGRLEAAKRRIPLINKVEDRVQSANGVQRVLEEVR